MSALNEIEKVFAERKVDPASLKPVAPATASLPMSDAARAASVAKTVAPLATKFAQLTNEVVFADLWHRTDLSLRYRTGDARLGSATVTLQPGARIN